MNTPAFSTEAAQHAPHPLSILLTEARYEILRLLRRPAFSVPTLILPLMFYLLFGVLMAPPHAGVDASHHALVGMSVFGIIAPGLFGLGVTLAIEREYGLLQLKRALPMPPGAYLGAKLIAAMGFAAVVTGCLLLLALLAGHVVLDARQCAGLLLANTLGVLPFCAIGLWIGTVAPAAGAPAVINLVYLPMAFLSGLWVPLQYLPHGLQALATIWPSYHMAQLSLWSLGDDAQGHPALHLLTLAAIMAAFFHEARRRLARA